MKHIKLDTWEEVNDYIDSGFLQISMSQFEHIVQHSSLYPKHAFSKGQLASKSWLLEQTGESESYTQVERECHSEPYWAVGLAV